VSVYASSVNRPKHRILKAGIGRVMVLLADRLVEEGVPVFKVRPGIGMTAMAKAVAGQYQTPIDGAAAPIRRLGQPIGVPNGPRRPQRTSGFHGRADARCRRISFEEAVICAYIKRKTS